MDAVKFIEERNRMCRSFGDRCKGCPAIGTLKSGIYCAVHPKSMTDAASQVAIVEKWSKEHHGKTRQDMLLEQWPNAEIRNDVLSACPIVFDSNFVCRLEDDTHYTCSDCRREFWMQKVE